MSSVGKGRERIVDGDGELVGGLGNGDEAVAAGERAGKRAW